MRNGPSHRISLHLKNMEIRHILQNIKDRWIVNSIVLYIQNTKAGTLAKMLNITSF